MNTAVQILCELSDPRVARGVASLERADVSDVWDEVFRLAIEHRALGNVARTLHAAEVEGARVFGRTIPGSYRLFLDPWTRGNEARNRTLVRGGATVCDILRAKGIDSAVRKGPALSWRAYGDLSTRVMTDVDVIVAPSRAAEACEVIAEIAVGRYAPKLSKRDRLLLAMTPVRDVFDIDIDGEIVEVEVADRILPRALPASFDLDAALGAASFEAVPGVPPFPQFALVDLFLDVCGHLYEDAKSVSAIKWGKDMLLGKYADLAALVPLVGDAIDQVVERVHDAAMVDMAYFALSVVEELWPDTVPMALRASLLPNDPDLMRVYGEVERERHTWDVASPVERMFTPARRQAAVGASTMYDIVSTTT